MLKSTLTQMSRIAKTKYIQRCSAHYIQGQVSDNNVREYFYFIDHQGQVSVPLLSTSSVNLTP